MCRFARTLFRRALCNARASPSIHLNFESSSNFKILLFLSLIALTLAAVEFILFPCFLQSQPRNAFASFCLLYRWCFVPSEFRKFSDLSPGAASAKDARACDIISRRVILFLFYRFRTFQVTSRFYKKIVLRGRRPSAPLKLLLIIALACDRALILLWSHRTTHTGLRTEKKEIKA